MKASHIDQLLATVPSTISTDQRQRLDAYVETVQQCEARIQWLRTELPRVFELRGGAPDPADTDMTVTTTQALAVVCELDTLERVQHRVDDWLKQYVAMLTAQPFVEAYGDG